MKVDAMILLTHNGQIRVAFVLLFGLMASSSAIAGFCNGVGTYRQCFNDDGSTTAIQGMGRNTYQVEQYDSHNRSRGGEVIYDYGNSGNRNNNDD